VSLTEYAYRAYTSSGERRDGLISAASQTEAREELRRSELVVVEVVPRTVPFASRSIHLRRPRVRVEDVAWMARNLAMCEAAGLPVFQATGMLARQRPGQPIGEVLARVHRALAEGVGLTAAIDSEEAAVGRLACALVAAGEAGGRLGESFGRLAEITEAQARLRRKVRSALVYPAVVAVLAASMLGAILIWVVPTFQRLYAQLKGRLPYPTRLLVAVSSGLARNAWMAPLLAAGAVAAWRLATRNPTVALRVDRAKLGTPLFGRLVRTATAVRVAATLGGLLDGGVPLLSALVLGARAAGNRVIEAALLSAKADVEHGRSLAVALSGTELPELMIRLTAVGEATGALGELLGRYASAAEAEVAATVDGLTKLIEPLLVVVLGVIVGAVVIALYLPMFRISQLVR